MLISSVISRQHVSSVQCCVWAKQRAWTVSARWITVYNLKACLRWQVSKASAVAPGPLSDIQTFTIGVLPQIPGFPQLAPDCDLQISVRDQINQKVTLKDWSPLELRCIETGNSPPQKKALIYDFKLISTFYIPHPPVCFLFMSILLVQSHETCQRWWICYRSCFISAPIQACGGCLCVSAGSGGSGDWDNAFSSVLHRLWDSQWEADVQHH